MIYVRGGHPGTAWGAFGVLAVTAAVGATFALGSLRDRRRLAHPERVAEQQIPRIALVAHGALATTTLISTLLLALDA